MKKLFLLVLACSLTVFATAQNWIGIKGGGGISLRMTNRAETQVPAINIVGGLSYRHQIFDRVLLEGNVLYDIKPGTIDWETAGPTLYSGSYVSVPLTIHWNTPFKKKELVPYRTGQPNSYWYVEGGPSLAYALDLEVHATTVPRKFDLGLVGGIGLNFGFAENLNRLSVGTRANYGLLNMFSDNSGNKTSNFTVGGFVQYDFALTKRRHIKYRW